MTRSFFCNDAASCRAPVHSSPVAASPRSLPSGEARPRLDFSDTFSQTFTRQLLLPPPPELPLPRSPIEYRAIVSVSQHLYLHCLRVASQYQKGSVVVISPPRLSQVATFDVATSHCLRLYAQAAAVVPKDSCACRLRDRGASSTEDGRTDGRTDLLTTSTTDERRPAAALDPADPALEV